MKIKFAVLLLFLVLLQTVSLKLSADIRLPAILGSHMVLQQKSEVNLWGWCAPSEKIIVKALARDTKRPTTYDILIPKQEI